MAGREAMMRVSSNSGRALAVTGLVLAVATANAAILPPARPDTIAALEKFSRNSCVPTTASVLDSVGIAGSRVKSLSYYASGGSADIRQSSNRLDAYIGLLDQP